DCSATGKTVYLEPLSVVEVNNNLAELEADERIEIHRILREMTAWVREHMAQLADTQDVLARLDELSARARLAEDLGGSMPRLERSGGILRIVRSRHPLLLLGRSSDGASAATSNRTERSAGREVIPLDLCLEGNTKALVISGPNMGGKTVVLKTVGLLVLMAISGLFVPAADGTVIPWVDEIFVDIGDEQSLDFDLSTYAGHLRNMEAILARATSRSLVLIDELGAGTDPDEGAALGLALLEEIGKRSCPCIATTHLGAFKAFASAAPGFANGAMEHDPETLAPTYTLQVGLPGRSHAFELARREGWSRSILQNASKLLSGDQVRTESLLTQIQRQREMLREEREQLRQEREELAEIRAESQRLSDALQEKIDLVQVEKAIEEDRRLQGLQRLLREVKERILQLEASEEVPDLSALRRWVHQQEREASALKKTQKRVVRRAGQTGARMLSPQELTPGRRAYSRSLGIEVTVAKCEQDTGRCWVLHKGLRVQVPVSDLAQPEAAERTEVPKSPVVIQTAGTEATREAAAEIVSFEVDLRGMDLETCLCQLDLYLDRAILTGLTVVRIIHGKGAGVLRRGVKQFLEAHRFVSSSRDGEPGEGGWGVTIAFLRPASDAAGKMSGAGKPKTGRTDPRGAIDGL
ncbi:MAG: Smr/MutS family protein, partial [Candidatus Eisenbacteria sp.]|nr:Smr/MutS family protein [Candidatus Eisenbacteria bacterium]